MTQEKEAPYANHPFVTGRRYFVKKPLTDPPFYYFTGFKEGEYITYNSQAHSIYDSCYGFRFWNKDGIGVRIDILEVNSDNINWDEYFEVHPEDKDKPEETKMYGRWIGEYGGLPKDIWDLLKPNNDPPYDNHPFVRGRRYVVKKNLEESVLEREEVPINLGDTILFDIQVNHKEYKFYAFVFINQNKSYTGFRLPYEKTGKIKWDEYFEVHPEDKDKPEVKEELPDLLR